MVWEFFLEVTFLEFFVLKIFICNICYIHILFILIRINVCVCVCVYVCSGTDIRFINDFTDMQYKTCTRDFLLSTDVLILMQLLCTSNMVEIYTVNSFLLRKIRKNYIHWTCRVLKTHSWFLLDIRTCYYICNLIV